MQLAALDWVLLALLVGSVALGAWRGLVHEVLSVAAWVMAVVFAQWFASEVGARLPMAGAGEPMRYAAGFVLVFVVVVFAGGLLAFLTSKLLTSVGLRPIDRVLGAGFGAMRAVLLVLAVTVVVGLTPLREAQAWRESVGAGAAEAVLAQVKPALPLDFRKHLP
jgi:membrane protein required for colicin V production